MPQDSRPPETPLNFEVDEDEHPINPQADERNDIVQNALQDIVLFAQDFLDVVDRLEMEPIIPQAIFFPRPVRPAGRFMLPVRGRGNFRPPAHPGNAMRPGLFGRRIPGVNFVPQVRPGDIPLRPAGLLGRPILRAGNIRDIARPGRPPVGIFRRQEHRDDIFAVFDDEDLEQAQAGPVAEQESFDTVDAYSNRSVALVEDSNRPAVMGCAPRRDLDEGVGTSRSLAEGASPTRPAPEEEDFNRLVAEIVNDIKLSHVVVEPDKSAGPSRSLAEGASPTRPAPEEADFNRLVVEIINDKKLSHVVVEPDMSTVMDEQPDRSASTEAEADRSAAKESNIVRPLITGTDAIQSVSTEKEPEEPSASMFQQDCQPPMPLKRARLDNLEPEREVQSKEDVLDKANEDSSESNGDD